MADESVVVKMVRTTQPDWSEGTLLYLKSFFGGEVGKTDKNFHKSTGTEGKDIQEGEDRSTLVVRWICLAEKGAGKPYEGKPHVRFDVAGDGKVLWRT